MDTKYLIKSSFLNLINIFIYMCNGRQILHLFLYNPQITESGWIIQSVHISNKGAQNTLEEHKKELREEWEKLPPEDRMTHPFGENQDWCILPFELLD